MRRTIRLSTMGRKPLIAAIGGRVTCHKRDRVPRLATQTEGCDVPHASRANRGYTLVEVLVAVSIVALLAGLILAAIQSVRSRAARALDENNLRQVGLAAQSYDTHHGRLPPLIDRKRYPAVLPDDPTAGAHWAVPTAVFLVPYLEGPSVASLYVGPVVGAAIHGLVLPAYSSPRDGTHVGGRLDRQRMPVANGDDFVGVGNYAFNVWAVGGPRAVESVGPALPGGGVAWSVSGRGTGLGNGFPDGTSGTLLLATKQGRCGNRGGSLFASARFTGFDLPVPEYADQDTAAAFFGHRLPSVEGVGPTFQAAPGAADCDADLAQGFERGLINVGMADGSVRTISTGIDGRLWRGALLPDDGARLSAE